MTLVLLERPPMFAEIDAAFKVAGKPIIFAWGDRIYNPERVRIPPALHAHERVHCQRQTAFGVEQWWRRYIEDAQFRFDEELPAHRSEYRMFLSRHGNANRRAEYLNAIAARLAGPLYGSMLSVDEARKQILGKAA